MLLRKHIANGRITKIFQLKWSVLYALRYETFRWFRDLCKKSLIIEVMGKHSNIIFCDENDKIIDSIQNIFPRRSVLCVRYRGRSISFQRPVKNSIRWRKTVNSFFLRSCGKKSDNYPKGNLFLLYGDQSVSSAGEISLSAHLLDADASTLKPCRKMKTASVE